MPVSVPRPAVVLVGAAILDVLVRPAGPEVFRSGSMPVEEIALTVGGDALNEATVLARLGADVRLQTVLGADAAGEMVLRHCRRCGIALAERAVRSGLATGVNVVLVQEGGERSFLTNPRGSLRALRLEDLSLTFPPEAGFLSLASIFVSPHLGPPELFTLFHAAKLQGLTVCADLTRPKRGERLEDLREVLPLIDYLLPNDSEAMALTGMDRPEDAAGALWRAGVRCVAVKCGARGCYLLEDGRGAWVPAVPDAVCRDTTGAGDSFAAGFLYALTRGRPAAECARFANACGARAVASTGAVRWTEEFPPGALAVWAAEKLP